MSPGNHQSGDGTPQLLKLVPVFDDPKSQRETGQKARTGEANQH